MRIKIFPKIKRRLWWVFILLLVFISSATPTFARQQDDIEIEVQAGYSGYFRSNKWTPIQITVRNNSNRDIQGTLQVRSQNEGSTQERIFQSPFFVRFGNARTEFIYATLEDENFLVELLDNTGRVLESTSVQATKIRNRDILYVVITEAPELVLMTERRIGSGTPYQANWSLEDIPTEAESLRSIDVIMLYDIRTGRLSVEQQEALRKWVYGGGHLIVHGGAGTNWQFAQQYLSNLLPTELVGSTTINTLEQLGRFTGFPSETLMTNNQQGFIVTRNMPKPNAVVLLEAENIPLIVRQEQGSGVVDFVALDPLSAPLNDYEATNAIWFELVSSRPIRQGWSYDFIDWRAADNAIRIVTNLDFPSSLTLILFLLAYITLIGPINYIVLNLIGRRELAWFTIPIFIVAFTAIAYFSGLSLRGDTATVNHLSVIQAYPDSELARMDGLVGIFSPRRTTYNIEVTEDIALRTLPNVDSVDSKLGEIPIQEEANYQVNNLPVDAGIVATFATSGYTQAPEYTGRAIWTLTDSRDVSLKGEIRLASTMPDLDDAVVLAQNGFYPLGDLKAGEVRTFDFSGQWTLSLNSPTHYPLGNRYEFFETTYISYNYNYTTWYGPTINPYVCGGGFNLTLAQVMYQQEFNCEQRGGSEEERIARRRALLLKAINYELGQNGGRGDAVYVIGWANIDDAEQNLYGIQLKDKDQINTYNNLYILKLPVEYQTSALTTIHIIPPGLLTWTVIDTQGFSAELSPYNMRLGSQDEVTFRFAPVGIFQNVEVRTLDLQIIVNASARQLEVHLWNWENGEWDSHNIVNDRITLTQPAAYLGPTNAIHINLRPAPNVTEVFIQMIEPTLIIS
ncbi:MAG: hypothetical protein CUN55_06440 [Phototrophicales bacterium]|nr:MAG: hypothetical protein CUN55_06440 [Phototrophicales bacterium]